MVHCASSNVAGDLSSYMGYSVKPALLKENYGFECNCPGCSEGIAAEEERKRLFVLITSTIIYRTSTVDTKSVFM
jgi:hypothetical protein